MSSDRNPTANTKLVCEFLGTFMLTFVVGLNLTECDGRTGFGPIACGCALMVLVYTFGPISGGHLNPAVTFSVLLQEGFPSSEDERGWQVALKYVIAQCVGGGLAGLASGFMVGFEKSGASVGPGGVQGIIIGAPLAEFLYTFLLCFTVLNVAVCYNKTSAKDGSPANDEGPPAGYGVAIGFVLIAAKGIVPVSGAILNPAVALGINFMGPSWKTLYLPIYVAVQLLGAFAATTALHIVRPASKNESAESLVGKNWLTQKSYELEAMFDPEDTAEFLGTFFIGLTITLNAMILVNPGAIWSVGACFMVMIYSLGSVSGGVFNPALTLAFSARWWGTGGGFGPEKLCDPQQSMKEWIKYFIHQLAGAAAGTGVTLLIYFLLPNQGYPIPEVKAAPVFNISNPDVHSETHTEGQAFFAEFFGTFFLCYVVLSIADSSVASPLKQYGAFCVGSCIIAAGYSFGSISGGMLNPAVTLCNSIGTFQIVTSSLPWLYMAAQCLGGICAAAIFRYGTHQHEMPQDKGEPLLTA